MAWKPLQPVGPGELRPCGENPSGSHLEFFAHPADVDGLLREGAVLRDGLGCARRYWVSLSPTPVYANGDIQVVLKEVA